jgi:ABC-2 type transport system permease protein
MSTKKKSRISAYARFLGAAFSANLQAVAEYRVSFLVQVFGMVLNNAAFAIFWGILIARTGNIGGYSFTDIMVIWALVSTSFGIAHVTWGNVRSLGQIIQRGELDVYLLQPKDVFINVLCSRTVVSAWGDLAYGFLVLAFLPGTTPERFLLFTLLAIAGAVIFASVFAAEESLTFFLGNAGSLSSAITEFMLSFSLYPDTIFDPGMRWIFYTILPTGFIAFVPLGIYRRMDWPFLPLLYLIAAVYAALSYALFRAGLRRYESGNQVGTRI